MTIEEEAAEEDDVDAMSVDGSDDGNPVAAVAAWFCVHPRAKSYHDSFTILDLAQQIIALTGARSKIVHLDARSGDIKHSRADISAIAQQLGFVPSIDFVQALEDTVAYYQSEQGS